VIGLLLGSNIRNMWRRTPPWRGASSRSMSTSRLRYRKKLLRNSFDFKGSLRFTNHREIEGEAYYRQACRRGWEGVIAKNGDSAYVSKRTRDWLKFKCVKEQEFVIGGYTEPHGNRIGFGALLVGSRP
jgi:ATP-dependent DNA ligase